MSVLGVEEGVSDPN